MRNSVSLLAGFILVAGVQDARAVTFTPDMWVYEVNLVAQYVDAPIYAFTDAYPGTPVPAGCTGGDFEAVYEGVPYTTIYCQDNPGINVLKEIGGAAQFAVNARIGFNETRIVCEADFFPGCPGSKDDYGSGGWFGVGYTDIALDAALGRLSFCGMFGYADYYACYDFSPDAVQVSNARRNVGNPDGFWDYGYGGTWRSYYPDNYVRYSGSGELVSSPEVVPLPASALTLGTALLACGAFGRRGRTTLLRNRS
jgi:hypothetical protein